MASNRPQEEEAAYQPNMCEICEKELALKGDFICTECFRRMCDEEEFSNQKDTDDSY